jgi:hypothetical protein
MSPITRIEPVIEVLSSGIETSTMSQKSGRRKVMIDERIIQHSRLAKPIGALTDNAVTFSLCRSFQGNTHAGYSRKSNKHFEAKFFPFASHQV